MQPIMSNFTPAEIARRVADLIAESPDKFNMHKFAGKSCHTPACIAGHIGIMHKDYYLRRHQNRAPYHPIPRWSERQSARLGLTTSAGQDLFTQDKYLHMQPADLSQVMLHLSKELEDATEPITAQQLQQITARALIPRPP